MMDKKSIIQKTLGKEDFVLKESLFHAVVLILCMEYNGQTHIVFQKRAKGITGAGDIGFPGGKVEKQDKTLKHAIIRETCEEMGIREEDLEISHKLFRTVGKDFSCIDVFLGFTTLTKLEQMTPNNKEVEEIFSSPLSFFLKEKPYVSYLTSQLIVSEQQLKKEAKYFPFFKEFLSLFPKEQRVYAEHKRRIFSYRTSFGIIWGLTAEILYQFIQILQSEEQEQSI